MVLNSIKMLYESLTFIDIYRFIDVSFFGLLHTLLLHVYTTAVIVRQPRLKIARHLVGYTQSGN